MRVTGGGGESATPMKFHSAPLKKISGVVPQQPYKAIASLYCVVLNISVPWLCQFFLLTC